MKSPDFGWAQIGDGTHVGDIPGGCAPPTCSRSDPAALHIYHFRSPSVDDDVKKIQDWHWRDVTEGDAAFDAASFAKVSAGMQILFETPAPLVVPLELAHAGHEVSDA